MPEVLRTALPLDVDDNDNYKEVQVMKTSCYFIANENKETMRL